MAASKLSPPNRQDPPEKLVKRTARVATDVTNTLRVPHDRFRDQSSAWYLTSNMPPLVRGNEVKYYIDARETFRDMVAAMRTATKRGHFIYLINWYCDVDFELLADEPGVNLRQILTQASDHQVMIRAMLWQHAAPIHWNQDNVRFLNSREVQITAQGPADVPAKEPLFDSAALHDGRGNDHLPIPIVGIFPKHVGTQHQKVLCVFGNEGLVCFVGGVDFNPDRIFGKAKQSSFIKDGRVHWKVEQVGDDVEHGQPLHDVHCRIAGPAAMELVNLFAQKWNDSDFGKKINAQPNRALIIPPAPPKAGDKLVQVARTLSRNSYDFAPKGERTVATMLSHAIRNAKRYIYTEDQYFVYSKDRFLNEHDDLQKALLHALRPGGIEHFTAVITHWEISDLIEINHHRRDLINSLTNVGGDRVRIFTLQPNGNTQAFEDGTERHTYVHSKIWIIDDEFVSIGTPNSNRRGWSKDNEVAAGIYETSTDAILHFRLAHWLRIELWKEHLNMNTVEANAELADGVASAVHWLRRPPDTRVRPYHLDEKNHRGQNDQPVPIPIIGPPLTETSAFWDTFLDPE